MANNSNYIQDWIADQYDTVQNLTTNQPPGSHATGTLAIVGNKSIYINNGTAWVLMKLSDQDRTGGVEIEMADYSYTGTLTSGGSLIWSQNSVTNTLFTWIDTNTLQAKKSGIFDVTTVAGFNTNALVSYGVAILISSDTQQHWAFSGAGTYGTPTIDQTNRVTLNHLTINAGDRVTGLVDFFGTGAGNYHNTKSESHFRLISEF